MPLAFTQEDFLVIYIYIYASPLGLQMFTCKNLMHFSHHNQFGRSRYLWVCRIFPVKNHFSWRKRCTVGSKSGNMFANLHDLKSNLTGREIEISK